MGKAATIAKNKYNAENYERINLVVKKGRKAALAAVAEEQGEKHQRIYKKGRGGKYVADTGKEIEL